jgi:hypothetical protein
MIKITAAERLSERKLKFTLADGRVSKDFNLTAEGRGVLSCIKGDEQLSKQVGQGSSLYFRMYDAAKQIFSGKVADLDFEIDDDLR